MSMIQSIKLDLIKDFTEAVLTEHGSGKPTVVAEKVAEVTYDMLEEKGLVQEHGNQTFVDIMLAAALLHDVFPAQDNWANVYQARYNFPAVGEKVEIPLSLQEGIYEAIEAQLGFAMPVMKSRPQPGTPQEIFANAVWTVNKYLV